MKIKLNLIWVISLFLFPLLGRNAMAYEVPRQDGKANFFYLFGPEGKPEDGKDTDTLNFYVDVPATSKEPVLIKVYDPNTGGKHDQGTYPWDTEMEFSVSGADLLDKASFGFNETDDAKDYAFGPYKADQGEKVGDYYRFKITVHALRGDDLNMFSFNISPNNSEFFTDKFTFVLLSDRGSQMYFYPFVPAGVGTITVRNFDMDPDGGVSRVTDLASGKKYSVNASESGKWTETKIPINSTADARLEYRVTTTNQKNGHAGLQVLDDKGEALPIYFRKGNKPAPEPKRKPEPKKRPAPEPIKSTLACNQFVFDARKSSDAESKNLTYEWDFGDGTKSTEPYVSHIFEKGGQYNVRLVVSDNSGLKCEKQATSTKVSVNTPPTASLKGAMLACAGDEVSLDASGSSDENSKDLSYRWNLGDGSVAEGPIVKKVYDKGGVYNVSVTVDDNAGSSCSQDSSSHVIKVNTPPVAKAGQPISICQRNSGQGFNVRFDGSTSYDADKGDNLNYLWDFGDGTQGEGAKVTHEYENGGEYTAKLTVTDNSGASCSVATDSIPVKLNKAPIAVAGKDRSTCSGSAVTFDASDSKVTGEEASYHWDFGDGETAEGKVVKHSYQKGGKYRATLSVDDGNKTDCSTSVDSFMVTVNGAPKAVLNKVEASCTGDKVTLDASSSSDPDGNNLKYAWDFGDGTTWEGKSKVIHQYQKGGTYKVMVSVDDGAGGSCSISADSTTLKVNTPPVSDAGPNLTCCTNDTSLFDGSGSKDPDGDPLSYSWNFGDGQSSDEAKTEHAYEKSGQYKVSLTVNDGSGTRCSQSSSGFTAKVNSEPVAVIEVKQK